MIFFRSAAALVVLLFVMASCSKNASTSLTPTALDSLKTVYQIINNDMDQIWTEMIMDDDGKLENMRRILQEISYSGSYNRLKFDSLSRKVEHLAQMRYDRQTMSKSDLITLYDSMTTEVMGELMQFSTSLPQFEQYPLMGRLLQEVYEADDRVLHYRIRYDKAAKEFNAFIDEHEGNMEQIANQTNLQPKPLFELPQ